MFGEWERKLGNWTILRPSLVCVSSSYWLEEMPQLVPLDPILSSTKILSLRTSNLP